MAGFRSRLGLTCLLVASAITGCGDDAEQVVHLSAPPDAGGSAGGMAVAPEPDRACDDIEVDGDIVLEHEKSFTATYRKGEAYEKTVMLFGGDRVEGDNALSNAYIIGLDKMDAQMLAMKYADFYLCSSPGGMEASRYIVSYDLVPASCDVYGQIVDALRQYQKNLAIGGDRTSLRFEGAPLELESVIEDATGNDVTDQVHDQSFHLVTSVEQLTGQSVISFGTGP